MERNCDEWTATAVDTLSPSQSLRNGETLASADGSFELGFFSPTVSSTSRFLGIWYKKVSKRTVVWVANRETPISDNKGVLLFSNHGILSLLNSTNSTVWSSNTSKTAQEPVVRLLNSGNLVVKDGKDNNPADNLWQSFDYPCETLLSGMKIGKNLVTGFEWFLSSWKSTDDPAPGQYFVRINISGYPQLVIEKGSKIAYRTDRGMVFAL
ncbi:PREDICTED: G-type lectin S-receptor-like serine/threonine-protein kinase At4g27290 [Theobroma cacao]|uniref:G-type lectin S-receptor-like serine/threonine-protein kinase At4g27290 n=1 Tax=Theobroma cacao TaxID=3641 RepID=A0AB32WLX1_THECC|nr:PREDICTED: G-type lectin S-receptor-like serine/threonine-protein kinase At4g27290 [Theobroma cacao]